MWRDDTFSQRNKMLCGNSSSQRDKTTTKIVREVDKTNYEIAIRCIFHMTLKRSKGGEG